ncbi:hypothetical protein Tco_0697195 [Tanacetum coccineum]
MLRTNSQAEIVSEEQLVPRANKFVIKNNNQRVALDSHITDIMLRFVVEILRHHKLYKLDTVRLPILQILSGIIHSANLDFASLIWYEFEWQAVKRSSRPSSMSKLLYTRFTKLIIIHFLSNNKSIPRISSYKFPSSQDDQPLTKLSNTIKGDYKFRMKIPNSMISDSIKKSAGYNYYMTKKKESAKDKIVDEPKEQHVSPKLKGPVVEDPAVQSLLDLRKGSKASKLENNDSEATLYSLISDTTEKSANETDDADESDMDLSDDNLNGDDDVVRYGVFMHNKSTKTPNSTYFGPTVTSSSLDYIQTLLDDTPANELMDFMSYPVYTDTQTTLVVHNLKGNPELKSYISGASEVPLAFKKAVQAKVLTEIKNLLPTHIPNALANYVKPRLNTSVLEVMQNNQISMFTQSSKSTNDLSKLDLKIKLLHIIQENKSNTTYPTNQKLYETLYEFVCLDHDALNDPNAEPSFYKRAHDNQDPLDNCEGENMKKRRKDFGEPSSKSSR